eukprot:CAMPEP_0119371098 /NCGR_PEP_ID=MMETSP1334-20130426/17347_1 /TAXON_ID=127549 /ORGANISM="Calcidiscus leptoporus, Strain RCC1130" /LENGTH=67 /DNA_ID=CAMNT_0007388303 /DNA_START=316 /DNA_END=519 /DNA_ORIENTATION=-
MGGILLAEDGRGDSITCTSKMLALLAYGGGATSKVLPLLTHGGTTTSKVLPLAMTGRVRRKPQRHWA